jgi:hypothetical protein
MWPPLWKTAGLSVVKAWIGWFQEDVTVFERADNRETTNKVTE